MNSMYLLDTNVVSELRKKKPDGAVLAWFRATEETQLHLSAVTIVMLKMHNAKTAIKRLQ